MGDKLKSFGRYLKQDGTVYILLVVLIVFFAFFNPNFLSARNIYNLITQSTYIIIAGMGICFVMIGGGIDLSVGQQMAVIGSISGIIMLETNLPFWVVWPIGIVLGFLMGSLNGIIASKLKLFPLIVTIATSEVFKGFAYTITESKSYSGMPEAFRALYKTKLLGLPLDVYLTIVIVIITWIVLNKTHFGRDVLAVGGNAECARLSGIKSNLIQTLCFAITGSIFAIATLDMLSQQNVTSASTGPGTEMTCLTAAIIGGISMMGGKGNVGGMVAGIFVMQIISNGMQLAGWGTYTQYIVKGVILLLAISYDALKGRPKPVVRIRKEKKPPMGMPPVDRMPPLGEKPPMGMPPMEGMPFDGPPKGWKPPMADISWVKNKYLDVPYGTESKSQCMDIYLPEEGEGPFPALIHIHGGGFAIGDKRDDHMDAYLKAIKRGMVAISVEYRLSGEAKFPAAVLDCREAIRFIREHAAEYKIDPEKLVAIGGSAGGNLAAMLAMNIPNGEFVGEEGKEFSATPYVKLGIDQFGPIYFKIMDDQARANGISKVEHDEPWSPESKYLGKPLSEATEAECAPASPATYISEKMSPMLIQHGTVDKLVPYEQSVEFVKDIEAKVGKDKVVFIPLEGADHEDKMFFGDENMNVVFEYIESRL
ncbi:MAG: alpha/beta hydrolase fold domain-containing protein [Agathobacter sp.]|nr:alpha/beta hydrolase fold domain-containing protein [Agathobacter sp.]